ncbi:MAG: hypothetical protein ACRDFZ_05270 [Candidatus Limnocylindria bacterium]
MSAIRPAHGLALIATIAAAVSCAGPSTAAPQSTASSVGASEAVAQGCPTIDLRTPSGDRIDLNGTWVTQKEGTRAGLYFFRQVGSCVWFVGGVPWATADDPGDLGIITVTFHGRVGADFVIRGDWIDVRADVLGLASSGGSLELGFEFGAEPDALRLVYLGGRGEPFVEPGYREEQTWVKVSDLGAYPVPTP